MEKKKLQEGQKVCISRRTGNFYKTFLLTFVLYNHSSYTQVLHMLLCVEREIYVSIIIIECREMQAQGAVVQVLGRGTGWCHGALGCGWAARRAKQQPGGDAGMGSGHRGRCVPVFPGDCSWRLSHAVITFL